MSYITGDCFWNIWGLYPFPYPGLLYRNRVNLLLHHPEEVLPLQRHYRAFWLKEGKENISFHFVLGWMRVTDCCWLKQEKHQMCMKLTGADNFGKCRTRQKALRNNLGTWKNQLLKMLKKCEQIFLEKIYSEKLAKSSSRCGILRLQTTFAARIYCKSLNLFLYLIVKISIFDWQFAILC